jgi:hypothetical protein
MHERMITSGAFVVVGQNGVWVHASEMKIVKVNQVI